LVDEEAKADGASSTSVEGSNESDVASRKRGRTETPAITTTTAPIVAEEAPLVLFHDSYQFHWPKHQNTSYSLTDHRRPILLVIGGGRR
jgi:hypothetical protein